MTNDHLLQQFSSINPVSDEDAERGLGTNEWQAMFEEIISREIPQLESHASRQRRRKAAFSAALLSAVVIVVALSTLWPGGPGGASPAAAAALRHAANVARSQRALPSPGPNQHLYTKTQERQTSMYVPGRGEDNFLFTQTLTIESWTSEDGRPGREVVNPKGVTFPTAADREAWEHAGKTDLEDTATDQRYREGGAFVLDLSKVPTDPDELLAAIERREILAGDEADWVTFQIIGELLHLCYRSPEHRAALYEVAANFPGVDYEGSVTDPTGRTGVSVSYVGGGQQREFIFDPDTAELLAERQVLIDQDKAGVEVGRDTAPGTIIAFAGPPGTVVYWQVFLETGVVQSTDKRP